MIDDAFAQNTYNASPSNTASTKVETAKTISGGAASRGNGGISFRARDPGWPLFQRCQVCDHVVGVFRIGNSGERHAGDNLVCPALFDLGEHKRVGILSVIVGDDKPLKYAGMFRAADLMLLNKINLIAYVDFDAGHPMIDILEISARTGEGMAAWQDWIQGTRRRENTGALGVEAAI